MPLSLWLIPYKDNPFTKTVQELIDDTVPRNFLSEDETQSFQPHVTVTGDINQETAFKGDNAQAWLDALRLPDFRAQSNEVIVELDTVQAEDPFFRKMNISVLDNDNLQELVAVSRYAAGIESEDQAKNWSKTEYRPHLSLLYADVPTKDVKNKVPLIESKIGFAFGDLFACCGGTLCMGGSLIVVDTSSKVREWKVLASRDAPWAMWRATRNLI